MEALFHLIFEIIKISILASIYATLTLLLFKLIGKYRPDSWFDRVARKKFKFWFISGFIITVGLFGFMTTHFGDHGLGDGARIPIGHFREIQEINGTQAYIQDIENGIYALDIDNFHITDDYVYGLAGSHNENYEGKFFLYDLDNNEVKTFKALTEYQNELKQNGLDQNAELKDFNYYYRKHWSGWRFWLLP